MSRKWLPQFLYDQLDRLPEGSRLLSIGAGGPVGQIVRDFAKCRYFEITELDIDSSRSPDVIGDICSYSAPARYDAILMIEVLEHISTPQTAIDNCYALLADGGILIGSTPFLFPIHDLPHDYFRFTRFGLSHLLARYGSCNVLERSGFFQALAIVISRGVQSDNKRIVALSVPLTLFFRLVWPILVVLDRVMPSVFSPNGYVWFAWKHEPFTNE